MSLMQKIREDQLTARKERDAVRASLLTTLFAEAAKVGKDDGNRESTDAEVVATIRKFLKSNAEAQRILTDNEALSVLQLEQTYLEGYLPKQLSETELKERVENLRKQGLNSVKDFMAHFKTAHAGEYDGALLSKVVKEALNGS